MAQNSSGDPVDEIVARIPSGAGRAHRFVVAIAGPPAAGKSTLAEALRMRLAERSVILGQDAFHYDDEILEQRGHRDRKGAPFTFDTAGYRRTLELARNERSSTIAIPRFDRELELSRNCADEVLDSHDVVITEGNYLLIDEPEWTALRPSFDLTVWIDAPLDLVRSRIQQRWTNLGFSEAEADARAATNDLPNAIFVKDRSLAADITVRAPQP